MLRKKTLSALKLLVAGALVSLVSTTSAGAVTTTWNFVPGGTPPADTLLPHSQVFTATDAVTTLTASAFAYTTGPNATTDANLYLEHVTDSPPPLGLNFLGVCSILNDAGTGCKTGGSGDSTTIDNLGPDEYLRLKLANPNWALVKAVLTSLDSSDQWYLYGSNSNDADNFFSPKSTLLASVIRTGGPCPTFVGGTPDQSHCTPTITDPFGIIGELIYEGDSHTNLEVLFNANAKNHLFQNYFFAADVNLTGQGNDTFGLVSFSGEPQEDGLQASVPEPATMTLLGVSLLGLGWIGRRRR